MCGMPASRISFVISSIVPRGIGSPFLLSRSLVTKKRGMKKENDTRVKNNRKPIKNALHPELGKRNITDPRKIADNNPNTRSIMVRALIKLAFSMGVLVVNILAESLALITIPSFLLMQMGEGENSILYRRCPLPES